MQSANELGHCSLEARSELNAQVPARREARKYNLLLSVRLEKLAPLFELASQRRVASRRAARDERRPETSCIGGQRLCAMQSERPAWTPAARPARSSAAPKQRQQVPTTSNIYHLLLWAVPWAWRAAGCWAAGQPRVATRSTETATRSAGANR